MSNYNCKEVLQVFGQNIHFTREKRNYKIQDLSKRANYSRIDLSKIEYGEKDIQLSTAIKLAKALDVPFPDLFSRNYITSYQQTSLYEKLGFQDTDYLLVFSTNVRAVFALLYKNENSIYPQIGMDPSTISRILNLRVKDPRISTLEAIAECVSKSLYDLFSRTNERSVF